MSFLHLMTGYFYENDTILLFPQLIMANIEYGWQITQFTSYFRSTFSRKCWNINISWYSGHKTKEGTVLSAKEKRIGVVILLSYFGLTVKIKCKINKSLVNNCYIFFKNDRGEYNQMEIFNFSFHALFVLYQQSTDQKNLVNAQWPHFRLAVMSSWNAKRSQGHEFDPHQHY